MIHDFSKISIFYLISICVSLNVAHRGSFQCKFLFFYFERCYKKSVQHIGGDFFWLDHTLKIGNFIIFMNKFFLSMTITQKLYKLKGSFLSQIEGILLLYGNTLYNTIKSIIIWKKKNY